VIVADDRHPSEFPAVAEDLLEMDLFIPAIVAPSRSFAIDDELFAVDLRNDDRMRFSSPSPSVAEDHSPMR